MPDRAVVDACAQILADLVDAEGPRAEAAKANARRCIAQRSQKPRALVAIREDRQWLVVLDDPVWKAYERVYVGMDSAYVFRYILADDASQDAHEVLATWLEGRET